MRSLVAASRWIMDLGPHLLIRTSPSEATVVRRAVRSGRLVRLAPGRYLRGDVHAALDDGSREIMRIIAVVSRLEAPVVISHASAARLWGLPRVETKPGAIETKPAVVEVIDPTITTVTLHRGVRRRPGPVDESDVVTIYGVRVTGIVRTCVDLAARSPFRVGVVALDSALRRELVTHESLLGALDDGGVRRGRVRAAELIRFADGRADRPGESMSRCVMREIGVVPPEVQVPFVGPDGQRAVVDFYWPGSRHVGEFDGKTKYEDSGRWSGLAPHEVVTNEKLREDWLRAHREVSGFTRWIWSDVVTPGRLERVLRHASVPFLDGR